MILKIMLRIMENTKNKSVIYPDYVAVVKDGGASSKIKGIYTGFKNIKKAFERNNIKINFYFTFRRYFKKIIQNLKNEIYFDWWIWIYCQHFKSLLAQNIVLNLDIDSGINNSEFEYCDINQKIKVDISKYESISVIHLAAVHFDFQSNYYETNVKGTSNVLDWIDKNNNIVNYVFLVVLQLMVIL